MTRIFTDGAETGDLLFFSSAGTTVSTTAPRSGSRCYALGGTVNIKNTPDLTEFYFRSGIKFGLATQDIFAFRNSANANLAKIATVNTGFVRLYIGSTLVGTGTHFVGDNGWHLVETYLKIDGSNGVFECRVDGVTDISFTGNTVATTPSIVTNILFQATSSAGSIDDLALNSASGTSDNGWCGDGKIVMLTPNANGDSSQMAGSDGNSTDNYLLVDEIPPNSDTDYVVSDVSGNADLYNLTTTTLPTNAVVKRVYVESRSREEVASGDSIKLGIKTNGSEYWSTSIVQTAIYGRNVGVDYLINPQTGSAWTQSEIDALQAGVKIG